MTSCSCSAWTCLEPNKPISCEQLQLPPLGETEVRVAVKYCGLCASDVGAFGPHAAMYKFPLVAGHEGVGVVVEVGTHVKHRKVGDHVGLGIYRDSCGDCRHCCAGKDNFCAGKKLMFTFGQTGAFGQQVQINERYAVPIPDGIPLEYAGPLMCAGQTVFAPFMNHNIRPGDRVGVVGIGGLGHLALRFSSAMGCVTTAFSRSETKKEEAESFGAKSFVATGNPEEANAAKSSQDFILMTAGGADIDWQQLLAFLDVGGKIIIMGFTGMAPIPVPPMQLIAQQKTVCGSAGGSLNVVRTMLDFAALHKTFPQVEVMPIEEVNEAIEKVTKGTVRYRAVLKFPDSSGGYDSPYLGPQGSDSE